METIGSSSGKSTLMLNLKIRSKSFDDTHQSRNSTDPSDEVTRVRFSIPGASHFHNDLLIQRLPFCRSICNRHDDVSSSETSIEHVVSMKNNLTTNSVSALQILESIFTAEKRE